MADIEATTQSTVNTFAVYDPRRNMVLFWTHTHPNPIPRGLYVYPADEGQWAPPEGVEIRP
jgi:hypothetical protein